MSGDWSTDTELHNTETLPREYDNTNLRSFVWHSPRSPVISKLGWHLERVYKRHFCKKYAK